MTRPKVLLIDDDPLCRATLAEALVLLGYLPLAVRDRGSAVDVLASEHVDLVLVDVRLDPRERDELARDVRSSNPGLPLLFLEVDSHSEADLGESLARTLLRDDTDELRQIPRRYP